MITALAAPTQVHVLLTILGQGTLLLLVLVIVIAANGGFAKTISSIEYLPLNTLFSTVILHSRSNPLESREMQAFKIVLTCAFAAILYGIVHDQFTAHICVEYFSVFHPHVFPTTSPALLALGWGVIATWWMGIFLGVLLAVAARVGSRNKIDLSELLRPISTLLLVMGFLATIAGLGGFLLARRGVIAPPGWIGSILPPAKHARFMADWWAHNASYLFGSLGGVLLCVLTIRKRLLQGRKARVA